MVRFTALAAVLAFAGTSMAQSFMESFDTTTGTPTGPIPANWTSVNNSPGGPGTNPNWQVRVDANPFGANSGAGYAFANFNSSTGSNSISNYLISPLVTFNNGDEIKFWTRTVNTPFFPDRLELVYNTDGTTNPASFTNSLVTVNGALTTAGYPTSWTLFSATISGLSGPTAGRFAFWYNPPNGGPSGANSDYVGIDDVMYTSVPAPASLALLGLGGLVAARRRRA
ncbi:MAG: choice-of-anchor J domain-containing protein [Phycisphaerales bacterium]